MDTVTWRKFFDFHPLNTNRMNGLCKLCNNNYKDRHGTFSNFLKHLKRKHPVEYDQISNCENECPTEEKNAGGGEQVTADLTSAKQKQNRIISSIAKNLIIGCNLPLNIVENFCFREFMKDCNVKWEPVSTKRLKHDIIPSFMKTAIKTIHSSLDQINHLTLTVDGWSDRRCRSFLGITCYFIDSNLIPQAVLIDFLRFKSPHTGENIRQLTEEVLDRFNIKEKVFKVVTDNASSMIKAYKFGLFGEEEVDAPGDQNSSMSDLSQVSDDYNQDVGPDMFYSIDVQSDDDFQKFEGSPATRLSCFMHTVQLCVRDGMKNRSYMSKVLAKCQSLAKISHKSTKIADLLDELDKHINKTNVTRWNSEFLLIKSILSVGKSNLESIAKLMDIPIKFSNNDLIILEETIDVLEPFYEISVKCQSEVHVTASLVVPAVVHLMVHLRNVKQTLLFCNNLVVQLQSSLEKRFAGVINRLNQSSVEPTDPFSDPVYFMAVVLDPVFKFHWIRDLQLAANTENRLKQNIVQLVLNEISKDFTAPTSKFDGNSSSTATSSMSSKPKIKRRKLFDYNNSSDDYSGDLTALDPAAELDIYLNDPARTRFSQYWLDSRLILLKKLVQRLFSVQASSAPIERVFSYAGLILSPRRTNMNEQLFRDLVFLKVNRSLL